MYKLTIATAAVAIGLAAPRSTGNDALSFRLKEEQVFIEYTPSKHEAVVVIQAESEIGLQRVDVLGPKKNYALRMRAQDLGGRSISGFVVETTEAPLAEVLASYGEGRYEMRASTEAGNGAVGSAMLVHDLLEEPTVIYPFQGAVNVPTEGLTVTWEPDTAATGYTVILEQGDSDGLVIELPPTSKSLVIPDGFLQPQTETIFEIVVRAENGNRTIREVTFTTL